MIFSTVRKLLRCSLALFLLCCLPGNRISLMAQEIINTDFSIHSQVSSNTIRPMWLTANQWGRYEQFGHLGLLAELGVDYKIVDRKYFSIQAGVRGLVNLDISESALQEAYLSGKAWVIDFSLGKEQYSPVVYDEALSSGLFLMNSNARPVPRFTIGVFDYLPLGFTKNWVEIRGGISQGWLNDDRVQKSNGANDVLLHEKFAYTRLGNTAVKPYIGLMHSALLGGTRPNGQKISVDFWATFMGEASSELGETNATGAHMGLWDFGIDWKAKFGDIHLYLQKPFADASGMRLRNFYNKDFILGLGLMLKDISWLRGVSVELFKTDHQSGYGIPDPLYPVDYKGHKQGSIIWMDDIEDDFDGFMYEVFGETRTGWCEDEVMRYLEVELDEGHRYGGRDDYMNNGEYYNGWVYHGATMGTPFYHTADKVRKYADGWDEIDRVNFYNNRVNGFHLGMEGDITPTLKYRFKSSYTINKGTFGEQFRGRYSWTRTEDYFFAESKQQVYTLLEVQYQLPRLQGLSFTGKVAWDVGELYKSVGGQISVRYAPQIIF